MIKAKLMDGDLKLHSIYRVKGSLHIYQYFKLVLNVLRSEECPKKMEGVLPLGGVRENSLILCYT